MQKLEKILEEIDEIKVGFDTECASECDLFDWSCGACVGECDEYIKEKAKEIIRKHMNDGWIPVDERLPEAEQEHVLACRRDGSIDTARYSPYSDRWYVGSMCSVSLDVIAWRPLPEPYRPERSRK